MTASKITENLDAVLPAIILAVNPRSCRALVARAGRPYALAFDEIVTAMNDKLAQNSDIPLREFVVRHSGRVITVLYAKVRETQVDFPKLRMLATSVETAAAEKPDSVLETYIRKLKDAIVERGKTADATLAELVGTGYKWDAAA